ncbi:MAG: hypothetical protein C5B49_05450 [Bdellovibrio sp.]|nr:MAG: hypothetical protein C5B49_05450 [Bdellovibrio sp.]
MTGILSRIFGSKKRNEGSEVENFIRSTTEGLLERAQFDLNFDMSCDPDEQGYPQIVINFSGPDEEILKEKEGQVIDAFQLFLQRVLQHHFPDDKTNVVIDCNGFREESNQALIELAEKLKSVALEKGKSVYIRALAPKDRKTVHQYLANDDRVRSRSVGDGLFKKIKIYPAKQSQPTEESATD